MLFIHTSEVKVYFHCEYTLIQVKRNKENSFTIICNSCVEHTKILDATKLCISPTLKTNFMSPLSIKSSVIFKFVSYKIKPLENDILNVYLILQIRHKFSKICILKIVTSVYIKSLYIILLDNLKFVKNF